MLRSLRWEDIRIERFSHTPLELFGNLVRTAEYQMMRHKTASDRCQAWLAEAKDDPEESGKEDASESRVPAGTCDKYGIDLDVFKQKTGRKPQQWTLLYCFCDDEHREPHTHKSYTHPPLPWTSTFPFTLPTFLHCCLSCMRGEFLSPTKQNITLEEDMPDSQLVAQTLWNRMDGQELRCADHLVYLPRMFYYNHQSYYLVSMKSVWPPFGVDKHRQTHIFPTGIASNAVPIQASIT